MEDQPRTIAALGHGTHACLIYDDSEAPLSLIAPFVARGLANRERCIFLFGEHSEQVVSAALRSAGIDVEQARTQGSLRLARTWGTPALVGKPEPRAVLEAYRRTIANTLAAGFAGLRIVADVTRSHYIRRLGERLVQYEAIGNEVYALEPVSAICLYNRSRLSTPVCLGALRTHPVVIVNGQVYDNPYYEPPKSILDGAAAAARLDWMLEQLRRSRDVAEARIQLVREQAARAEAEAAIRARDEFISIAAHELRTPLTGLRGYAQLATRRLNEHEEENRGLEGLRTMLQIIERESRKLDALVRRLLDVTRIEAGRLILEPEQRDVVALVEDTVAQTRVMVPDRRISVQAPGRLEAVLDPVRLEQVLVNLLDNAIKFSAPDTTIEIEIRQEHAEAIALIVRDHGVGIPPHARERIFDRYHRAHEGHPGMGLGLFISREIVRLHGGQLTVEAPEDGGARFVVQLPLRPDEQTFQGTLGETGSVEPDPA